MLNIDFYNTSGFFHLKEFKSGDIIFDEGSLDENLYIIVLGNVSVGKYTTTEKKEIKELAVLKEFDFFGEASLNTNAPKEAVLKAINDVKLIYINGKNEIQGFIEKFPKEGLDLLSYIIESTNKRLVLANKLITANYEIVKSITDIENISEKSIYGIIEKIKLITGYDYILYFEINPVVKDYTILKYDTREYGKFKDIVIERKKITNIKDLNEIVLENYNFIQKLSIGNADLGFLIFGNKNSFTYEDKRLILSISNNLTGLLKQKEILKDELNKKLLKEI